MLLPLQTAVPHHRGCDDQNLCVNPRWFLEALLDRARPEGSTSTWLRQITLECGDVMARHTAARLIAHACCCGANDPDEAVLLVAVERGTGRALHR